MDEKLHSIWEIADILGVGPSSVQKYIETGMLRARRMKIPLSAKSVWHSTDKEIEEFRARRAAKARIKEQAERFGDGLNGKQP